MKLKFNFGEGEIHARMRGDARIVLNDKHVVPEEIRVNDNQLEIVGRVSMAVASRLTSDDNRSGFLLTVNTAAGGFSAKMFWVAINTTDKATFFDITFLSSGDIKDEQGHSISFHQAFALLMQALKVE